MAEPAYPLTFPETQDGRPWPAQGEWTYEDYLRLPDDGNRYEVIRGFLYAMPAPGYDHQFSVVRLARFFDVFVAANDLGVVLVAPFDVLLPRGLGDPVEPDVLFIPRQNQPRSGARNFAGVPALVVEVLSPSTRRVDQRVKFDAYREAGIPEYWLVDSLARTVVVYRLSEDGTRYDELCRGGVGDTVSSAVLPGLRIEVSELFPR
jgi:Uma2 family endonuclease